VRNGAPLSRWRDTGRVTSKESPDPVELSRLVLEALNRGNLDVAVSVLASGAIYESVGLGTSARGRTAIRHFYEDWLSSYEEFTLELEDFLDLGDGVIFGVIRASGRPVGSSARVDFRFASVSVWEQGLIVRHTTNGDIDQARTVADRLAEERG
jgi:ketosteroid isomerase-like protein